jgi:hypothetical protein
MMAVTGEPLRETAQRALIEAHIAEGDWAKGRRSFEPYRNLLDRELDVQPDLELASIVHGSGGGLSSPHWLHRVLPCGITTSDQPESTVGWAITAIKHRPGTDQTGYAYFAAKIEAIATPLYKGPNGEQSCAEGCSQAEGNDAQREVQ